MESQTRNSPSVLLLFIAVQDAPHKESAPYDGIFIKVLL